jgi:hypothetical protein
VFHGATFVRKNFDYPRASFAAVRESASSTFRRFVPLQRRRSEWGRTGMQMVARGDHIGADDLMRHESKSRSERPAAGLAAILAQKHG